MRRLRVACTAACASGVITPTIGTSSRSWSSGSAAEVAALHAATIELHALRLEVPGDLACEAADLVQRARPVREAARGRRGR